MIQSLCAFCMVIINCTLHRYQCNLLWVELFSRSCRLQSNTSQYTEHTVTAITSYVGVPYEILLGKEYIPRIPGVACPCIMCCGSSRFPGSPLQPSNNNMGILYTLGTARDITGLTMFPNPEFYSRRNNTLSANFDYSYN